MSVRICIVFACVFAVFACVCIKFVRICIVSVSCLHAPVPCMDVSISCLYVSVSVCVHRTEIVLVCKGQMYWGNNIVYAGYIKSIS